MQKLLRFVFFVFSAAMFIGGICLFGAGLLASDRNHISFGIVGVMLAAFGLFLLWTGFIAPRFGIKGQR